MIIIDNVVIEDDITQEVFTCNLAACKGACCVEGDSGAPLTQAESDTLAQIYPKLKPYLRKEGKEAISLQGTSCVNPNDNEIETPLVNGKECAYAIFENGIVKCGIEKAYYAGTINFLKPISCHLYPIRVVLKGNFEYLQYHMWHICVPGCRNGAKTGIKLYRFLETALRRKYGDVFFDTLVAIVEGKMGA